MVFIYLISDLDLTVTYGQGEGEKNTFTAHIYLKIRMTVIQST